MSRGWKTNYNRSDLRQIAETAIKYARWVPGAGIDIDVLVQMQRIWLSKLKLFWYMLIRNFVNHKK